MLIERIEARWIDAFTNTLGLCGVAAGDEVAVLSETQSRAVRAGEADLRAGLLEEQSCAGQALASAAARERLPRFLEMGGQTRAVEIDLPDALPLLGTAR